MTDRVKKIIDGLDTADVDSVQKALTEIQAIPDFSTAEKNDVALALSDVFVHAHYTGFTTMPRLAVKTEAVLAGFGSDIIPFVADQILEADSESAAYFGQTLTKFGGEGLDYVLANWTSFEEKDGNLINLLLALSYFNIADAITAMPILLKKVRDPDHQMAAAAIYAIGRLVQKLKAQWFDANLRQKMFEAVLGTLSHMQGVVRKNAASTLGKMFRKGLLTDEQRTKVYKEFLAITGKDEQNRWDRAFIVRREAESFLPYFNRRVHSSGKYTQSFRIVSKRVVCPHTCHFTIEAPYIARKIEAGQFIIIRPNILSERIPLSVCGWDREQGTIDINVSAVGKTSSQINAMEPGETFQDVVGPLGERSVLPPHAGTCVVIGGGYGAGAIVPIAKDLQRNGNKVIGIIGARSWEYIIMEEELRRVCHDVIITTNDGSEGMQGFVTDALATILDRERVIHVVAIGPVPMMKAVSDMTRSPEIQTYVSLNAIMVDGTGMCGACRVTVGGASKFACFHGPEFDGHKVDFENLMKRQKMFAREEKLALEDINVNV